MKRLIAGLYLLFGFLLAGTILLAVRSYDGLVEEGYSRQGERFLADREREEEMGLTVSVPTRLDTGINRISTELSTRFGPLRGADAAMRAMRIRGPDDDREVHLREERPGLYTGDLRIPSPGTWMLQLTVEGGGIRARRNWFVTAATPAAETDEPSSGIHRGPVTGDAGSQRVILEVEPRPVRVMTELTFRVRLPGYEGTSSPFIDLTMPGMRMPPNRVELVRTRNGFFRGTGVVVRCSNGNRTWQAAVTVPGKGIAAFLFDVVP